jgi:hypothetical protein
LTNVQPTELTSVEYTLHVDTVSGNADAGAKAEPVPDGITTAAKIITGTTLAAPLRTMTAPIPATRIPTRLSPRMPRPLGRTTQSAASVCGPADDEVPPVALAGNVAVLYASRAVAKSSSLEAPARRAAAAA